MIAGTIGKGRGPDWSSQALDVCTKAEALHDRLVTEPPLALSDGGRERTPADRWSDTERSIGQLAAELQSLRINAPTYPTGQATEELIVALAALHYALQAQHGGPAIASTPAAELASTARVRLVEFDAAVQALRGAT